MDASIQFKEHFVPSTNLETQVQRQLDLDVEQQEHFARGFEKALQT